MARSPRGRGAPSAQTTTPPTGTVRRGGNAGQKPAGTPGGQQPASDLPARLNAVASMRKRNANETLIRNNLTGLASQIGPEQLVKEMANRGVEISQADFDAPAEAQTNLATGELEPVTSADDSLPPVDDGDIDPEVIAQAAEDAAGEGLAPAQLAEIQQAGADEQLLSEAGFTDDDIRGMSEEQFAQTVADIKKYNQDEAAKAAAVAQQATDAAANGAIPDETDTAQQVTQQASVPPEERSLFGVNIPAMTTTRGASAVMPAAQTATPLAGLRDQPDAPEAPAPQAGVPATGDQIYSILTSLMPNTQAFSQYMVGPNAADVARMESPFPPPAPPPTPGIEPMPPTGMPASRVQVNLAEVPKIDTSDPNVAYAGAFIPRVPARDVQSAADMANAARTEPQQPRQSRLRSLITRAGMNMPPEKTLQAPWMYRNLPTAASNLAHWGANLGLGTALVGGLGYGVGRLIAPEATGNLIGNLSKSMGFSQAKRGNREEQMRRAMERLSRPMVERTDSP